VIGADFMFVANPGCSLSVTSKLEKNSGAITAPIGKLFEPFVTGIRYVPYATGMQVVSARNALLALCAPAPTPVMT
jgi:hypothetical protein